MADTFFDCLCQFAQMDVAGDDFSEAVDYSNEGALQLFGFYPDGAQK